MALHPVITARDAATMSPAELLHFTDAPVAHAAAYRDYQRHNQITLRNTDAIAAYLRRRDHMIAAFFHEAANAVATMEAYS